MALLRVHLVLLLVGFALPAVCLLGVSVWQLWSQGQLSLQTNWIAALSPELWVIWGSGVVFVALLTSRHRWLRGVGRVLVLCGGWLLLGWAVVSQSWFALSGLRHATGFVGWRHHPSIHKMFLVHLGTWFVPGVALACAPLLVWLVLHLLPLRDWLVVAHTQTTSFFWRWWTLILFGVLLLIPVSTPLSSLLSLPLGTRLQVREGTPIDTRLLALKSDKQHRRTAAHNLVMIVMPGVRPDATTLVRPMLETTPFLKRLQRHSLWTTRLRAIVPNGQKSLVPLLCGIPPALSHQLVAARNQAIPGRCLPHLLRPLGYRSALMTSGTLRAGPMFQLASNMGFDTALGQTHMSRLGYYEELRPGVWEDRILLRPALAWIDRVCSEKKRFALTLLTHTSLPPFRLPKMTPKRGFGMGMPSAHRRYLHSLRYQDQLVQSLVWHLRKRKLMRSTLVVVVSPHGVGFGEGGKWGHDNNLRRESTDGMVLIHHPALFPKPKQAKGPRSQLDLLPTLLPLLGLRVERPLLSGVPLQQAAVKDRILPMACRNPTTCLGVLRGNKQVFVDVAAFDKAGRTKRKDMGSLLAWTSRVNWSYRLQVTRNREKAVLTRIPFLSKSSGWLLGNRLQVIGVQTRQQPLRPGAIWRVSVLFQARAPIPKNWKLFVHFEVERYRGKRRKQMVEVIRQFHQWAGGRHAASRWPVGRFISEPMSFMVPGGQSKGDMAKVYIGVWTPRKGILSFRDASGRLVNGKKRLLLLEMPIRHE